MRPPARSAIDSQRWLAPVLGASSLAFVVWSPIGSASYPVLQMAVAPVVIGVGLVVALVNGWTFRRDTVVAALGVVATFGVSAVASASPWIAVVGMPYRNAGLLSLLVMLGSAALGAVLGSRTDGRRLVAFSICGVGGIVSLLALVHFAGLPLAGLAKVPSPRRAIAPFGSATQLGAVTAMATPIAVWVILDTRVRRGRVLGALCGTLSVGALLASQSRAAWIGASIGTMLLVAGRVVAARGSRRSTIGLRRFVGPAVAAGVIALVLLGLAPLRARTGDLVELGSGTGAARRESWSAGFEAMQGRWLLGAGPDQTRSVLPTVLDADYESRSGGGDLLDRAHDVVIDQLLWTGLLGLAAFAALGAVWWRAARSNRAEPEWLALAAGCAAYGTHLLANFPIPEIDRLAWFAMGALAGGAVAMRGAPRRAFRLASASSVAIIGLALALVGVRSIVADGRLHDAVVAERTGDPNALQRFESAAAAAPEQLLYREAHARALLRAGSPDAVEVAERVRALAPGDPFSIEIALRARTMQAFLTSDLDGAARIVDEYEVLERRVPSRVQFRVGHALAVLASGEAEQARTMLQSAAAALPYDRDTMQTLAAVDDLLGYDDEAATLRALIEELPSG